MGGNPPCSRGVEESRSRGLGVNKRVPGCGSTLVSHSALDFLTLPFVFIYIPGLFRRFRGAESREVRTTGHSREGGNPAPGLGGSARFAEWIPAFAGMTAGWSADASQMTPLPEFSTSCPHVFLAPPFVFIYIPGLFRHFRSAGSREVRTTGHSREGGNPAPGLAGSARLAEWIPAFAGMTTEAVFLAPPFVFIYIPGLFRRFLVARRAGARM